MRRSILAVLALTARYAVYARAQGREDVAEVLDRVPARGASTFREALQSLRILHFAMWCEGGLPQHAGPLRPVHAPLL